MSFLNAGNQFSGEEGLESSHFLYDYYGITDESRQDPPSPGTSPGARDYPSDDTGSHGNPSFFHMHGNTNSYEEQLTPLASRISHQNQDNISHCGASSHDPRDSIREHKSDIIHPSRYNSYQSDDMGIINERHDSIINERHEYSMQPSRRSVSTATAVKPETPSNQCSPKESKDTTELDLAFESSLQGSSLLRVHLPPSQSHQQVFKDEDRYLFVLEAQTSVIQRRDEDSLTYLNKGQFYYITFEGRGDAVEGKRLKSIIHLVFRDEKDPVNELTHWSYWHAHQPNKNQRAFDVDRKGCQNIDDEIEEIGYNAMAFVWNPRQRAKVSICINCLSTDFSAQKGVKGIPLHLQIDTYEEFEVGHSSTGKRETRDRAIHRAFCQIKVFRDKGAERKNKDESKTAEKRMLKFMKQNGGQISTLQQNIASVFQVANKVTVLHSAPPQELKSVVFVPSKHFPKTPFLPESEAAAKSPEHEIISEFSLIRDRVEAKRGFSTQLSCTKEDMEDLTVLPKKINSRTLYKRIEPLITIYVRKEEERAYNAVMLNSLTVQELKEQMAYKYDIPDDMEINALKKTKKGLLVNLDDQIISQWVDEDDFIIQLEFDNQQGKFDLIFRT